MSNLGRPYAASTFDSRTNGKEKQTMSAYMVSKEHIDILVMTAIYGPAEASDRNRWYPAHGYSIAVSPQTADELGAALIAENLASIHARYPDTITNPQNTPGPAVRYWESAYKFPKVGHIGKPLPALDAIGAVRSYTYQSCEHHGWETSDVKRFCASLIDNLISYVPGYDRVPWRFDEPIVSVLPV
jgi:hypothetical protein